MRGQLKMENELLQQALDLVMNPNPDTGLVSLNQLYKIGNKLRILKGKNQLYLRDFVGSPNTKEFLTALTEEIDATSPDNFIKVVHGSKGGTFVHPIVALEAMGKIDSALRVVAYKELFEVMF
jgi:hypothetical protein